MASRLRRLGKYSDDGQQHIYNYILFVERTENSYANVVKLIKALFTYFFVGLFPCSSLAVYICLLSRNFVLSFSVQLKKSGTFSVVQHILCSRKKSENARNKKSNLR